MTNKLSYTEQDFTYDYINHLGFNDCCILPVPVRPIKYPKTFKTDLAKSTLNKLGVKETKKIQALNSYLGHLQEFAWLSSSVKKGAFMTDLNFIIDEIAEKYSQQRETLQTIRRRLVYLNYCQDELNYILKTYKLNDDWKNYVISKIEAYASMGAETLIQLADFYIVKVLNICDSKELKFETFLSKLKKANENTNKYIAELLYCFILFALRNRISHTAHNFCTFEEDKVIIQMDNIDVNMKYVNMEAYLDDLISRYRGKKKRDSMVTITDPDFSFLTATLKIGKKGKVLKEETKFNINIELDRLFRLREFLVYNLLRDTVYKDVGNKE